MRLLIVEDEEVLAETIKEVFKRENYIVDTIYDGYDGYLEASTNIYDAIILDVMLPTMDGFEIIKKLRGEGIDTPTIMLTAKRELDDKVSGLNYGADDYLTKPFQIKELVARVNAISRRSGTVVVDDLVFGDITLDSKNNEIKTDKANVRLSAKEYQLLEYFIKNKDQIITREQIAEKLWGLESDTEYNNVEVYISFLRKKIKFINSKVNIKSMRNVGYKIEEIK